MTTQERIRNCLLLENMKENKEAAKRLGLQDLSRMEQRNNRIMEGNLESAGDYQQDVVSLR